MMNALRSLAGTARLAASRTAARFARPVRDGIAFRCNLCGHTNRVHAVRIARETPSCIVCRSTVRFRAIGRLVMREVLRSDVSVVDVRQRHAIEGLGLSDAAPYARALARAFAYTNTFLHRAPRLDILDPPRSMHGRYRFVIGSEVFEHVAPPVQRAFENVRRLLGDGGVFIFTAPFTAAAATVEHFPDLHEWRVERQREHCRVLNTTRDGRRQVFDDPVFHGGRGTTLEMRVFALAALQAHFAAAGFSRIRVADEPCEALGIAWRPSTSPPIVAYA